MRRLFFMILRASLTSQMLKSSSILRLILRACDGSAGKSARFGYGGGGSQRFASVWSFGDNSNGALGISFPLLDAYEPTKVGSLPEDVTTLAAGHYHSLAVTSEGNVWAWGRNVEGQLGRGTVSPRDTWSKPERVRGLDNVKVKAAYASGVVSAAIGDDGSLWVWGRSKRGQLGLGKGVTEAIKPTKVEGIAEHEITKVSFGWGHALALTNSGKLYGWGYAEDGRLGKMEKLVAERIEKEKNMPVNWEPTLVQELSSIEIVDVACGLDHSLVLCCDGTVLSCGDNTYGQLGRDAKRLNTVSIPVNHHPLAVSAGLGHSLLLCRIPSTGDSDEATGILSWGWNASSQLGRRGQENVPALVDGLEGIRLVSVSAGRVHSLALTSRGGVMAWGSGRNGRLGLGSSTDEAEPAFVDGLEGFEVLQAIAGFDHSLLLVAPSSTKLHEDGATAVNALDANEVQEVKNDGGPKWSGAV
ncbi:hypothetical protein HPP92_003455 [Vanilla planifolia]|uniref:RCC1-like domain-containing protein n=1 Tax=Vanilla planifolia TaxID=51239 RepID=A0A835S689_VANPL|nr:hypothetical protein HPP92_003455 [Vanilla planifolia]